MSEAISRTEKRSCAHCGSVYEVTVSGRGRKPICCSELCTRDRQNKLHQERLLSCGECEHEGCTDRKRSPGALWCERHYGIERRLGRADARLLVRKPNGRCYHCGGAVDGKTLFCSSSCRRRDRRDIAYSGPPTCVACLGLMPDEARDDRLTCSLSCYRVLERARRYGVGPDDLYRAIQEADGHCGSCGRLADELAVDHCHKSGKVRGLLCSQCNVGIGMFGDDPGRMLAAALYVLKARGDEWGLEGFHQAREIAGQLGAAA